MTGGSSVQEVIAALQAAVAALPTSSAAAALIAAQEGGRGAQARRAVLDLLLARAGSPAAYRASGALGPAAAAENLGERLAASADEYLRLDVRKLNSVTGAVTEKYDPLLLARASVAGLADAGSGEVLNTAGQYRSFPLLQEGAPAAQALRVGRNGAALLVGFDAEENAAYRITVSAVAERVDAAALQQALESLPPATMAGGFLSNVAAAHGAALPAVGERKPGELFVVAGPPPALYWLRPAAAVAVTNRNRVQVVAQAGSGAAFEAWEDGFSAAATPENDGDFLGALARRAEPQTANRYRYAVYLRQSMLAGLGIDAARDGGVKCYATVGGAVRAFKRFAEASEVVYRGQRYAEFATDAIADLPAFVQGTTYSLLFWTDAGGAAPLEYKPASRQAAGAWELVSRLGHIGRLIAKRALPTAPGGPGAQLSEQVWTVESAFADDWRQQTQGGSKGDLQFHGFSSQPGIVVRTKVGAVVTSCWSFPFTPGLAPNDDSNWPTATDSYRQYLLPTSSDAVARNVVLEFRDRARGQPKERLRLRSCGDTLEANATIEVLEWVA